MSLLKTQRGRWIFAVVLALSTTTAYAGGGAGGGDGMAHRMTALVLQVGVIVLVARLANAAFKKLTLPGVVGELVGGILIGPFALGAVALPGFEHGLFGTGAPAGAGAFPVTPELYGICAVASVVLLFMVGLETDIGLFMRYSLTGSLVGAGGVLSAFVFGDLMAVAFSPVLFGQQLGFMDPPCLLLGIVSTPTSVGITARILSEQRKLDTPEGVTILAGAVVDDVLGIILLAVGMGVITASAGTGSVDWGHIGVIAAKAFGIWIAATAIGLHFARKLSVMLKMFRHHVSIAVMALGLALILAGLFEQAGLAMIIGAYVMGLSLSRTDISHVVQENLHPVSAFLVPVFFTVMGMLVDIRMLLSREVLLFGLLYTAVANIAKAAGCGLPSMLTSFNARGALRTGMGMLPRGEVTLIIAGTALAAGLLNQQVFGVAVLMTLLTALIAPPLQVKTLGLRGSGLRRALQVPEGEHVRFAMPNVRTAEMMVHKLLATFEAEGFYVQTLDRNESLFRLMKDEVSIGFRRDGTDLLFECRPDEAALVGTCMIEVVADFERMIRELRKPMDREELGRRIQQERPESRPTALAPYIHRATLSPRLAATTKEEVIDELLALLTSAGLVRDAERARRVVLEREAAMSTGMQYGIAIPHGRTDAVDRLVCAIGIKSEGIDFDSIDGLPSRIFVLVLSPRSETAPQMQFMSTVSQVLNEAGRNALLACESADDMQSLLTGGQQPHGLLARIAERRPRGGESRAAAGLDAWVRPGSVKPALSATDKPGVIHELLELLARGGIPLDVAAASEAVLAREKTMSTGMQHGLAIPHARIEGLPRMVCAVGTSRAGIDFGSLDGEPSRIFVLTLAPLSGPAPLIQLMVDISRKLDEEGRRRVLAATTPEELWRALTE